ncbi:MAG: beta-ketoacyl-[acyl-carrier-protein] synthase [Nevskia sp.]|nr:beta-ketoacyl-[acyl-carrier-protein] synthase [Nevskia sp.]
MNPLGISHYTVTSSLGRGLASHLEALRAERTGLRQQPFETSTVPGWIGEVDGLDTPLAGTLAEWDCRNNRLAELGLQQDGFIAAVARATQRYGAERVGVFIGTSTSGVQQTELAYRARDRALDRLPDWFNLRTTQSTFSAADFVRLRLGLRGVAVAISTACSSSAKVFASAHRAMRAGLCEVAVVGRVDTLCLTTLYGVNALQQVSPEICRPADVRRQGLSLGEAAGFALLTPDDGTAELLLQGYGESSDAYHMSTPDPDGRGAATAMREALRRGAVAPAAVDYINLHGTGTPANDLAEDKAVIGLLGSDVPCSSTKSWSGHTLGAAGILEAVIALLCLQDGLLPRSLNTQAKDPALRANILLESRRAQLRRVLSNSFGFGGNNCSLLLGRRA